MTAVWIGWFLNYNFLVSLRVPLGQGRSELILLLWEKYNLKHLHIKKIKVRWNVMFLIFIRQGKKKKLPQMLFLGYSLIKICFQAETQCVFTPSYYLSSPVWSPEGIHQSWHGALSKTMVALLGLTSCQRHPFMLVPWGYLLHQASCSKWLVLCGEFCSWKRQKTKALEDLGKVPRGSD